MPITDVVQIIQIDLTDDSFIDSVDDRIFWSRVHFEINEKGSKIQITNRGCNMIDPFLYFLRLYDKLWIFVTPYENILILQYDLSLSLSRCISRIVYNSIETEVFDYLLHSSYD